VARGRIQRQIKRASKGHEDEKFSYLVLTRGERPVLYSSVEEEAAGWPRILQEPIKRNRHVIFDLCSPNGELERKVVSQSQGKEAGYKQARRAVQGDTWPFPFPEVEERERFD